MPIVLKSGSLNLLVPLGPVPACNGIDLPFHCFIVYVAPVNIMRQTNYDLESRCWIPDKERRVYLHTDSRSSAEANQVLTFWDNAINYVCRSDVKVTNN
jgi:hypothetical protein